MRAIRGIVVAVSVVVGCVMPAELGEVDVDPELADGNPQEWSGPADDAEGELATTMEALLASPAASDPAPTAPPPDPGAAGGVSYEREMRERRYGVHIYDQRHRDPKVVYSVRLRDLTPGERLVVNAEVTLSRCNEKDILGLSGDARITPCNTGDLQRSPYAYTPNFSAAIVLGTSASDARGPRLSTWFEQRCPKNRHHCARALPELVIDEGSIPDSGERWVNLVVTSDANGANARSFDVMEVEQAHGGLHVTRVAGASDARPDPVRDEDLVASAIPIDRTDSRGISGEERRIVYRVRLDGLRPGDVISATGRFYASLGGYGTDPLITSQILLVADSDRVRTTGMHDRELTARNGHNCYDHSGQPTCVYGKSGQIRVPSGAPSTMWLNLVAAAVRSDAAPNGNNRVHLHDRDGHLEVRVRR